LYMGYIDKNNPKIAFRFSKMQMLWENEKILIVEGESSKLGVYSNYFDNAKYIRRIICPSHNAFEKYDEIYSNIKKHYQEGELVLIALGPTATILAYDLA